MPYPWQSQSSRPGTGSGPGRPPFRPEDPSSCVPEPDGKTGRGRLTIINGIVRDCRIRQHIIPRLDVGPLQTINAIVVHQTDSSNVAGTLSWWSRDYESREPTKHNPNQRNDGAHFIIDKHGTGTDPKNRAGIYTDAAIYQTNFLTRKCQHAGPIRARCLQMFSCTKDEMQTYSRLETTATKQSYRQESDLEIRKPYPQRWPYNGDSIGIEIVSLFLKDAASTSQSFEEITDEQQNSLRWLVQGLLSSLNLRQTDVYTHAQIAHKMKGEGREAHWTTSNDSNGH